MNKYMMDDDRDILYAGAGWNVYMNEINTTTVKTIMAKSWLNLSTI
jgi:hypothetical protein